MAGKYNWFNPDRRVEVSREEGEARLDAFIEQHRAETTPEKLAERRQAQRDLDSRRKARSARENACHDHAVIRAKHGSHTRAVWDGKTSRYIPTDDDYDANDPLGGSF